MSDVPQFEARAGSPSRRILFGTLMAVLLVVVLVGGFALGQRKPLVVVEDADCLSMTGTISCALGDGWTVSPSTEVMWTGVDGTRHEGIRPACLPPTGDGTRTVRLAWVAVEVDGVGWRQVVHVECLN